MRLCRFTTADHPEPRCAIINGNTLRVVADLFTLEPTGATAPLDAARLVAPVEPSKIVAVGLNYRDHAGEMNKAVPAEPMIFLKPSTSVIGPGDTIVRPPQSNRVDHESELGVVISRRCRHLTRDGALAAVLGYTCVNDVTARDLQAKDVQYSRAKGFDTFCPLGPWIETRLDPGNVNVETRVNGELRQRGHTADMVHQVADLLVFITAAMTLLPGDVVATGTPPGVGPLQAGDVVEISVEGIGALRNPVA